VRQVRLSLGGSVYDPHEPVGRLLFDVLAMVAEFESDLIRLRTKEGMRVAKAKGRLRGKQPKLNPRQEAHLVSLYRQEEHGTAELGRPLRRRALRRLPRPATRPITSRGPSAHHRRRSQHATVSGRRSPGCSASQTAAGHPGHPEPGCHVNRRRFGLRDAGP
jgi:hypothetical protein